MNEMFSTQRRKGAARQAATKEPEQEETEKTEGKNFAENAEFSRIALQRVFARFASWRLGDFALECLRYPFARPRPDGRFFASPRWCRIPAAFRPDSWLYSWCIPG